jgi:hypothetical protein
MAERPDIEEHHAALRSRPRFAHLILTRYALRMPDGTLPSAEWLAHRRPIFEAHCLPSVAAQTEPAFTWLLLYDASLTDVAEALPSWQARCPHLRGVPTAQPWEEFNATMRDAIHAALPPDATHVITTRLDNDDAIAPDFVALLQAAARERGARPRYFLNFEIGENWTLATDTRAPHWHPTNMFISCVEPASDVRGIYTWAHNSVGQHGEVVELPQRGRWTHIMHDRNVWPAGRTASAEEVAHG